MTVSRRVFLRTASIVGLTTVIPGGLKGIAFGQQVGTSSTGFSIPEEALEARLARIDQSMFRQTLNTSYEFRIGKKRVNLSLIKVIDLQPEAATPGTKRGECFSLVFQGPTDLEIAQGTYVVRHTEFGKLQLFIVPGDKTGQDGHNYEALFNRLPE